MRVLFICPKSGFHVITYQLPPMGPLALASFLQTRGHIVRIFDHELEHGLSKAVGKFKPDAVAVTLLCESMIPDAIQMSRALKGLGLPVFWGGHLASAIPEEAARSGCVDYVGISEGEYTLLELLEVVEGKRARETVLGIAYVDEDGEYHRTADRPFADLADFPPLNYSLIPVKRYLSSLPISARAFAMTTSKGCPFSCTFCFSPEYHRCQRRAYPNDVILQQVKTLAENYGVDGIYFVDELFGANKQELKAFCQGMQNLGLELTWFTETAIGTLTREDMDMMYAAGCRMLAFGLESGSAETRKALHKYYNASKTDETFRNCREAGIFTHGLFMIGLPDETPEQVRETVRLYLRLHPDEMGITFYTPIPGSQLYQELVASGRLMPPKTLEAIKHHSMPRLSLTQNFSRIPGKHLQVIQKFILWQLVFGKKPKIPGVKRSSVFLIGIQNLFCSLRNIGLRGLVYGLWEAARLFFTVAWYANAYPSIRKEYDLSTKNFGRTDWD